MAKKDEEQVCKSDEVFLETVKRDTGHNTFGSICDKMVVTQKMYKSIKRKFKKQ